VATAPERPGTNDWSQLEKSFFESAPPDVAVAPPPAPTFDDLGPIVLPERRKTRRSAPSRVPASRAARPRPSFATGQAWLVLLVAGLDRRARALLARVRPVLARTRPALARVRSALARLRPTLAALVRARARVRPTLARARTWGVAVSGTARVRLAVSVRRAKESTRPALRDAVTRFFAELPGERPDGRTVLATLVAMVVLCGLSATVLGSRGVAWLPPAAPAVSAPSVAQTP
jgi:hypothetical protein